MIGLICFIHVRASYFNLHIFIVYSSLKKPFSGYFHIVNSDCLPECSELFWKKKKSHFYAHLEMSQRQAGKRNYRGCQEWGVVAGGVWWAREGRQECGGKAAKDSQGMRVLEGR